MIYSSVICWGSAQVSSWDKLRAVCQLLFKLTPPPSCSGHKTCTSRLVLVSCCLGTVKTIVCHGTGSALFLCKLQNRSSRLQQGGCLPQSFCNGGGREEQSVTAVTSAKLSERRGSWWVIFCTTWRMFWTRLKLTWNFKSSVDSINAVPTSLILVLVMSDQKNPFPLCFLLFSERLCGTGSISTWDFFFPPRLKDDFVPQLPPEIMNLISLSQSYWADESTLNSQTLL